MANRERQMLELRRLRDAAKGLIREDVAFLKGEQGGKSVAPRLMDSASGKAREAAEVANEHKLKIGTGIALGLGAFAAWIFRDRIEKAFDQVLEFIADEGEGVEDGDTAETAEATDKPHSE